MCCKLFAGSLLGFEGADCKSNFTLKRDCKSSAQSFCLVIIVMLLTCVDLLVRWQISPVLIIPVQDVEYIVELAFENHQ